MRYDFDTVVNRRGTNCSKWDIADHELPMWIADMDFQTAPEIIAAIKERADHGVFGYGEVPDSWAQAYAGWWQRRHNFTIDTDWLIFATGVVPAISSIVRKLTTPAENVLVMTPVYNIFFNSILNNGRRVLESELQYDGQAYQIDFADLEQKLADPQTTLLLLCNPHNPVGKIWDREALAKVGALCAAYHVVVVADEIHCDLTDPSLGYVPFASVSVECAQNSITCLAPTKTFNLAGLQTAAVAVPNPVLRHKVRRGLNTDEVAEPNAFAITAAEAAFTQGEAWLEELRVYLYENKQRVREFVAQELPEISVVPSQATYLLWLDCHRLSTSSSELARFIREQTGLRLSAGRDYGRNSDQFLRLNAACPRAILEDGLRRLRDGVRAYQSASEK